MNKVALITGASDGLGKGIARVFAGAGWDLVLVARSQDKLMSFADELRASGARLLTVVADVSSACEVQSMVARAQQTFDRIDVLINNAAIDYPGSIEELTVAQWDRVIGVNLSGVFYAAKAVFPAMKRQRAGYIVNISSVAGRKGWPNAAAYCASKFALTGLTQALGSEGKPHNIRCSVVYPGGMDTSWHPERHPEFLDTEDVGRFLLHMVTQDPRFVVNEAVITPLVEQGYP